MVITQKEALEILEDKEKAVALMGLVYLDLLIQRINLYNNKDLGAINRKWILGF